MTRRNQKGYALLELLLVVILLGILAAMAVPRLVTSRDETQLRSCQHNMHALNAAIEEYHFYNDDWPNLTDITANTSFFPDGPPVCTASGAFYSINAEHRIVCSVHGTL